VIVIDVLNCDNDSHHLLSSDVNIHQKLLGQLLKQYFSSTLLTYLYWRIAIGGWTLNDSFLTKRGELNQS